MLSLKRVEDYFSSKLKRRKSLDDNWDYWNNKIFTHWQTIENLMIIRDFKGIKELDFTFLELFALI